MELQRVMNNLASFKQIIYEQKLIIILSWLREAKHFYFPGNTILPKDGGNGCEDLVSVIKNK